MNHLQIDRLEDDETRVSCLWKTNYFYCFTSKVSNIFRKGFHARTFKFRIKNNLTQQIFTINFPPRNVFKQEIENCESGQRGNFVEFKNNLLNSKGRRQNIYPSIKLICRHTSFSFSLYIFYLCSLRTAPVDSCKHCENERLWNEDLMILNTVRRSGELMASKSFSRLLKRKQLAQLLAFDFIIYIIILVVF